MSLAFLPDFNAGPITNLFARTGSMPGFPYFSFTYCKSRYYYLLTLLLFLAVGLSFASGSVWLVSITVTALVINIYPTVLLLLAFMAVAFFVVKNYWR
jgi:hypothetical protein